MEQSKLEAFFNARLPLTDLENIQDEQNLNDSVDLLDNNNKVSSKENEIIIVDDISTDIISKCGGEGRVNIPSDVIINHDHNVQSEKQIQTAKQTTAKDKPLEKDKCRYLSSWEKESVCFYETYVYDIKNIMHEKKICWLYNKKDINGDDRLYCKLCEKYQRTLATNGKINSWCTGGYRILKISKIKQHAASSTHQEAQELELKTSSNSQPNWLVTQNKERSKHEVSIQNLILSAIYLCQQDQSINSFEKLCVLMEALGVKLLPAELGGISYRNDNAAIEFLRHVSAYLHEELVDKINKSPSIGWMLDESTSRTVQKSLIIYVRLFENNEAKTKFYGILELDGDGTAHNIVESIKSFWRKDGLNPEKTCWFATDNAATFTGVNNGVVVKLKRDFGLEFVELNTCVAHSFALVGSQAGFFKEENSGSKAKKRDLLSKLENTIGKIYSYFGSSASRTFKLKCWQNLLDIPELKFKRLFHIRWTAIRDSIKPIMLNIIPTNQALFATLESTKFNKNLTVDDRVAAEELLNSILDDQFLFMLHFHYDLHECVLEELTKILQDDDLPYFTMMNILNEKKKILNNWLSQSGEPEPILGPSLNDYTNSTAKNQSYGAFKIVVGERSQLKNECFTHINRLLIEIDKRFKPSEVQQYFIVLFEPDHLIQNKNKIGESGYGRQELDFLRIKYQNLNGFSMEKCRVEWEKMKISLSEFVSNNQEKNSRRMFWKSFILWKEIIDNSFHEQYKNILILLSIYLISPLSSTECERGYSVANRIHTNGRSRIMTETLDVLMNVRLLLSDDLRSDRCRQVIQQAYNTWNNIDTNRRIFKTKLIIDVPDDYEPLKQVRSARKRKQGSTNDGYLVESKKLKIKGIKCANRCGKFIVDDDPEETYAIQCCHQNEYYDWIEASCSRWLCNICRIKLGISIDTTSWFCEDCIDMHTEE